MKDKKDLSKQIERTCRLKIKEKEFRNLYKKCKPLINKFTKFDCKISSTIERNCIK